MPHPTTRPCVSQYIKRTLIAIVCIVFAVKLAVIACAHASQVFMALSSVRLFGGAATNMTAFLIWLCLIVYFGYKVVATARVQRIKTFFLSLALIILSIYFATISADQLVDSGGIIFIYCLLGVSFTVGCILATIHDNKFKG